MKSRLRLLLSIIFFGIPQKNWALLWPIQPQNSAHSLYKTYGDWNGFIVQDGVTLGYHSGVDIRADSLTPFYAVENGVIAYCVYDTSYHGYIGIRKNNTDTIAWWYGHVYLKLKPGGDSLKPGDTIAISESLGVVANFPPDRNDHLHFDRCGCDADSGWYKYIAYLNPLDSLAPSPSQIPHIMLREGTPVPHHPYYIYYVRDKSEDTLNSYERTYLRDSVDIVVRAYTNVNGIEKSGIYAIGYEVQPKNSGGSIPFRKMVEMQGVIQLSDSLKYYLTYADSVVSRYEDWYIVTNCGSGFPQPGYGLSNIQENCWPTKINIAGTGNADSIEDARFPDGYYITTIKVWAHSGDSAVAMDTVLVDNFNPRVKETYPTNWYHWITKEEKKFWS